MLGVKVFRVSGTSMLARFRDSDYVLAMGLPWLKFKSGHVVLVLHSSLGLIIKRIFVAEFNGYKLVGDHPSSTSSEQMGWVKRSQIVGRVFYHIPS